jgi:hypothetical protein
MVRSDVHAWFTAYDREQRARKEGRAGLAWLGLVGGEDEEQRPELAYFERNVEPVGPVSSHGEGMPVSKPVDTATRLALLLWAGTIASLAVLFG